MIIRSLIATGVSLALLSAPMALAADDHAHEPGKEHGQEEQHFNVAPPATVKDAWAMIGAKVSAAETDLAANKLEAVHEAGEALEVAVHTLSEKSDMVADKDKAKLASALKQLDKSVDAMHHAAEDGDSAMAGAELKKIKGLLPLVEGLYPAGALR
jgi:hypothetical protein